MKATVILPLVALALVAALVGAIVFATTRPPAGSQDMKRFQDGLPALGTALNRTQTP